MLTAEKIVVFKNYKGYYDGYYIQNKDNERIISDDEWIMLNNLIQEIFLIRTGVTSKSFEEGIVNKLYAVCDNKFTVDLVFEVEQYLSTGV